MSSSWDSSFRQKHLKGYAQWDKKDSLTDFAGLRAFKPFYLGLNAKALGGEKSYSLTQCWVPVFHNWLNPAVYLKCDNVQC